MSLTSSQASAASVSVSSELECEPSHSAKSNLTLAPSSPTTGHTSPAMTTSEPSPEIVSEQTAFPWMSSAEASPVRTSAALERVQALRASAAAYGRNTADLLASYDPGSSSWKTSQHCLVEGLTSFSETWPRSGLMQNGTAYQLPPLVRLTDEIDFGLWPTPVVPNGGRSVAHVNDWRGRTAYHNGKKVQVDLAQAVKRWPTPHGFSQDGRSNGPSGNELGRAVNRAMVPTPKLPSVGGQMARATPGGGIRKLEDWVSADQGQNTGSLNPTWVEWLMGYPAEWTALKDSATPSSRRSRKSSGEQS